MEKEKQFIKFAKLDDKAIIPSARDEDAGLDVYANLKDEKDIIIGVGEIVMVPTGIISACDAGHAFVIRERGSSGTKGMSVRCGVIDSGFRGEWIIVLNNTGVKPIVITKKNIEDAQAEYEGCIVYPASKGIAQALYLPVERCKVEELSVDEVKNIKSERGDGRLGSSGK